MIALLTLATALGGNICDDTDGGIGLGPAIANPRPGDLGNGHRVCPRTEVVGSLGGAAVIDLPNFYGSLAGGLTASGSYAIDERTEVFGQLEVFRYDALISAFSDSAIGPGHTTLGVSSRVAEGSFWGLATHGRAVLPTAFALYRRAHPFAFDAGATLAFRAGPLRPHASVVTLFSVAASAGPADPWIGVGWTAGTELRLHPRFGLVLDTTGTWGYGAGAALDHISLAPALRAGLTQRVGLELAGHVPLAGRDYAPLGVELAVAGRWP